ncbi:Hypothetical_protein [Hexamita inflata]|uniref:Hypothetical_protein n=1 Tax=Hexamita inflata TaxID=28002 RepID=A0AA86NU54_9EUKA|nr:Hypothetical protein HINF_LOCUS13610 [Hexamita inflata]CAI9926003.1 Hypothetical protein HINF_LOCUS13648 [Hexamita inflata]CAI9933924.1 Hypothetical protein HINF_LOCUS21569 [Hexamita inflata]
MKQNLKKEFEQIQKITQVSDFDNIFEVKEHLNHRICLMTNLRKRMDLGLEDSELKLQMLKKDIAAQELQQNCMRQLSADVYLNRADAAQQQESEYKQVRDRAEKAVRQYQALIEDAEFRLSAIKDKAQRQSQNAEETFNNLLILKSELQIENNQPLKHLEKELKEAKKKLKTAQNETENNAKQTDAELKYLFKILKYDVKQLKERKHNFVQEEAKICAQMQQEFWAKNEIDVEQSRSDALEIKANMYQVESSEDILAQTTSKSKKVVKIVEHQEKEYKDLKKECKDTKKIKNNELIMKKQDIEHKINSSKYKQTENKETKRKYSSKNQSEDEQESIDQLKDIDNLQIYKEAQDQINLKKTQQIIDNNKLQKSKRIDEETEAEQLKSRLVDQLVSNVTVKQESPLNSRDGTLHEDYYFANQISNQSHDSITQEPLNMTNNNQYQYDSNMGYNSNYSQQNYQSTKLYNESFQNDESQCSQNYQNPPPAPVQYQPQQQNHTTYQNAWTDHINSQKRNAALQVDIPTKKKLLIQQQFDQRGKVLDKQEIMVTTSPLYGPAYVEYKKKQLEKEQKSWHSDFKVTQKPKQYVIRPINIDPDYKIPESVCYFENMKTAVEKTTFQNKLVDFECGKLTKEQNVKSQREMRILALKRNWTPSKCSTTTLCKLGIKSSWIAFKYKLGGSSNS